MNHTAKESLSLPEATIQRHRYQIYRQDRNGCHHPHGPILDSQENAVAQFLHTPPEFEGGGLRLWDHREERLVGSAEWNLEVTGFGFPVRARFNVFYDPNLTILAHVIGEREALEETVAGGLRMSV